MHVVICGGGVIGAATAYFLTELGVEATVVERCSIAAAASGKAGGFLARDWCDGNAMGPLARASFDLHAELAERLDADYGYRRVDTLMVAGADEGSVARPGRTGRAARLPASAWLDGNCAVHGRIGSPETTAQVEPGAFTRALVDAACRGGGASVRIGNREGLLAAAARTGRRPGWWWTARRSPRTRSSSPWGPGPPLPGNGSRCRRSAGSRGSASPFARTSRRRRRCCSASTAPRAAKSCRPRSTRVRTARCGCAGCRTTSRFQSILRTCGWTRRAATSFAGSPAPSRRGSRAPRSRAARPATGRSAPTRCRSSGAVRHARPGVFVATGHNCWGILNAPASGKAMAELIATGEARTVDLSPFDPARLLKAA